MNKYFSVLLLALVVLLLPGTDAFSTMQDYAFTVGTGSEVDMSKAQTIIKPGVASSTSEVYDIGFKFEFDGTVYSTFSASSSGVLGLGKSTVTSAYDELFEKSSTYPIIAPFWDYLITNGNGVGYLLTGKTGSQVLTIQWEATPAKASTKGETFKFQVRLYEGTNKIEFWYGTMTQRTSTKGKIGAAVDNKNLASLYFGKKGETIDYGATQTVDLTANGITSGTLYTFEPTYCTTTLTGNVAEGGTSGMKSGDVLLSGKSVQRGSAAAYRPFQMSTTTKCVTINFTFTVTGANASDYVVSPASSTVTPGGAVTPTITFTPGCLGTRSATLTITGDNGFTASYPLAAVGTTRINWTGNTGSGGVSPLVNGALLLSGQKVKYGLTQTFTPFTLQNFSTATGTKAASVTYAIDDPTGQYSLDLSSAALGNGASSTPVVTFRPTRFGVQNAVLTVTADCEVRSFTLSATAIGAGAEFTANGKVVDEKSDLFVKAYECSGESVNSLEIKVRSLGNDPLLVTGAEFFGTDSLYGQGIPAYPLLRDTKGNAIPAMDYFLTDFPGLAPANANEPFTFPIVLQPGESRTFYLNFVAQRPGKRLARIFIATNALNFVGKATNGATTDGLLTMDLFGKGLGSAVTATLDGRPLTTVDFGVEGLYASHDTTIMIYNSGICDLRISRSAFRVSSGDSREFSIIGGLVGAMSDQDGNYLIAPGDSATVTIRFTPTRTGSRRATLLMQTNDSTALVPGLTERGAYYWDLFGRGRVGLGTSSVSFSPSTIDDPERKGSQAAAAVSNTAREPMTIVGMEIAGADAAEFSMDPQHPWPALPFAFMPGETMTFGVVHNPASGSAAGSREAQLLLITSSGDTIMVVLSAEAATRTLLVGPATIFDGVTVSIGKAARQTVMITNTGSQAVQLGTTTITGANANEYTLNPLPRLVMAPGQTEFLEVTYRPVMVGGSTAQLTVASNATNGAQTVQLGGNGRFLQGTSGVDMETGTTGMKLGHAVPNPAHDAMELTYSVATSGDVLLKLYDVQGREVRLLANGFREAGEYRAQVDLRDLPGGAYYYRLEQNGESLSGVVTVVK